MYNSAFAHLHLHPDKYTEQETLHALKLHWLILPITPKSSLNIEREGGNKNDI